MILDSDLSLEIKFFYKVYFLPNMIQQNSKNSFKKTVQKQIFTCFCKNPVSDIVYSYYFLCIYTVDELRLCQDCENKVIFTNVLSTRRLVSKVDLELFQNKLL